MGETPRKRIKYDRDDEWDEMFVSQVEESMAEHNQQAEINKEKTTENTSVGTKNTPGAAVPTTVRSFNAPGTSSSLKRKSTSGLNWASSSTSVIKETQDIGITARPSLHNFDKLRQKPQCAQNMSAGTKKCEQCEEVLNKLKTLETEKKKLEEELKSKSGEAKVMRDRYNTLTKESNREIQKHKDTVELIMKENNDNEAKFKKQNDKLKTDLEFQRQEILNLQTRSRQDEQSQRVLQPRRQPSTRTIGLQCDEVPNKRMKENNRLKLNFVEGEMSGCNVISRILWEVNESLILSSEISKHKEYREEYHESAYYSDDNSPWDGLDSQMSEETNSSSDKSQKSISLPNETRFPIIRNLLLLINSNFSDNYLEDRKLLFLSLIGNHFVKYIETLHSLFPTKPVQKSSSAESYFNGSSPNSSSTSSSTQSARQSLKDMQQEHLLLLKIFRKLIGDNPNIIDKVIINFESLEESPVSVYDMTIAENTSVVDCLSKIIHLHNLFSEKLIPIYHQEIVKEILKIFEQLTVTTQSQSLRQLFAKGMVSYCLKLEMGANIINACLDFAISFIKLSDSVDWICTTKSSNCFLLRVSALCELIPQYQVDKTVLIKITELVLTIMMQKSSYTIMFPEHPKECNCCTRILNSLTMVMTQSAEECNDADLDYQFWLRTKGAFFLNCFSTLDRFFPVRSEASADCFDRFLKNSYEALRNIGIHFAASNATDVNRMRNLCFQIFGYYDINSKSCIKMLDWPNVKSLILCPSPFIYDL